MTNDRYQKIAAAAKKARENKKKTFETVSADIEENKSISRKEKALLNGRNYFKSTYTTRKAQEYYSGVADFNKKYNEYMKNTGENYRSADEIADWESKRKSAYENDNKKYAVSQALQQVKNNNFDSAKSITSIDKAGNNISKTNKSMIDYWSQFTSEDEYNRHLENQRLLAYDVTAAKQSLEQLKANKPAQFSSMGMNDNRGNMTSALENSDYKKWEQDVATLENEISEAENLQQYVEYMKSPEYQREYEEYNQFMQRYNAMNGFDKFVNQTGNLALSTLINTAADFNSFLELGNNALNTIFGVNTYEENTLPNYVNQFFELSNNESARQNKYNEWYNQGLKSDITNLTGNEELSGFLADTLTNTATAIAEVIPNIALSYATGGLSAAPSMIKATSGLTKSQQISQMVQSAFKGIAKDPNFYYSFIREGGNAYSEAKQSGASELEAAIAMFSTGLPNAFIEIGGGVEQLPKLTDASGVKEWIKRFAKTGKEEAMEEVKQGIVSQLMAKATYAPEMELFTINGDGVIDPVRMLQEAYGGFVGGAFGAGVNYAVNKINLQSYNNALKDYKVNTMTDATTLTKLQDIVSKSSNADFTELYNEFKKAKEINAKIPASTYIQLYDYMTSEIETQKTNYIAGYLQNIGFSETEAADVAPVFLKINDGKTIDEQDIDKIYNSDVALDLVNSIVDTTMSKNQMLYAINNGELDALSTKIIEKSIDADIQKIAENNKRATEAAEYIGLKRAEIYNDVYGEVVMVGTVNNVPTRLRLVSTDSGAVLLKTDSGDVVDADNVQFSNAATQAIVNLAGDYDTATAQAFIDGYDGTMTAGDYASLFGKVYNLSMTTNTLSYEDMNAAFAPVMGVNVENAVKAAYMAGRNAVKIQQEEYNARQEQRRAAQKERSGKVKVDNSVDRNLVKNERSIAKFIAKSTGYDVEIINDEKNAQGSFNSTENKIVINLADGNFYATALHETTHFVALNAPDEYKAFKDEVMKWLSQNGTLEETMKKYAASYAKAGVKNIADLTEEVAANAAESLMKSESFVENLFTDKDFIEHIVKTKSKSFVQRVMERLRSIISAVKQYLSNANPNHDVAKALSKDVTELEKVEKLWVNAFKAAAENRAVQSSAKENTDTESSGVKYSIKEDTNGDKFVIIEEDIFANSNGETFAKTIAKIISSKFNNLIETNGQKIKINKITNDEWRRSPQATKLMKNSPDIYSDKLKAIVNADEILEVANNWIGEKLLHNRKDNIIEFARGSVAFKVGNNGYSADVIVGIEQSGSAVLYDLINIYSKKITEVQATGKAKSSPRILNTSATNNISQSSQNVNTNNEKYSLPETDNDAENVEDIYGFKIKQGVEVNEDLLELLSIYDKNAKVDTNGNVTVYHRTTADAAEKIRQTGIMTAKEDALFFSSEDSGYASDYGDTVITLKIPSTILEVNDVFDGEVHFDLPLRYKNGVYSLNVSRYLKDTGAKFSIAEDMTELDKKYLSAIQKGDTVTAQKLVDEAAKKAGYTIKAYHGTTNQEEKSVWNSTTKTWDTEYRPITVFKKQYSEQVGHFFNSDIDNAGGYGSELYSVYLMLKKPLVINCNGQNYSSITHDGKEMDTYEWADYAKKHRYDGVIFENISDGVDYDALSRLTTDYVVFDSNRIKSAEPVTYDNKGEIIPLSERFKVTNRDIRYSIPEQSSAEYELLLDKNEDLRKQVEALKSEMKLTKGHKVNPEAVKKLTNKILREYSSKADKEEISARLEQIFNYTARDDADAALAKQAMYDVARRIIDSSQSLNNELYDTYKPAAERLRNTTIRITPALKSEIEYTYGSYQNFRRSYFGRLKLNTQSGTPIDVVYSDLISEFNLGGVLDEGISDKDMINSLVDFVEMIKPQAENPYAQDTGTVTADLAQEIFDAYFETPEIKTFADKQQEKLQKAVNKSRKYIAEQRESDKARYEKRLEKVKAENKEKIQKLQQRISDLKDKNDTATKELKAKLYRQIGELKSKNTEKLLAQKAKYQDMAKRKRERRRETELRHKISKVTIDISKRLLSPEKNKYIPKEFETAVADFLSQLDIDTHNLHKGQPTKLTQTLDALNRAYGNIIKDSGSDIEYNETIKSMIEDLASATNGQSIYTLSLDELQTVYDLVRALKHLIVDTVGITLENKKIETARAAGEFIRETEKADTNFLSKLFTLGLTGKDASINAYRTLESMGGYDDNSNFAKLARTLREKESLWMDISNEGSDIFRELTKDKKNLDKFQGKKAEFVDIGIKDPDGKPVKVTHAMLVSIYMMALDEGNRAHIEKGGLTILTDESVYRSNKKDKYSSNSYTVKLTLDNLMKIADNMTDYDKAWANAAQKFFDVFSKKLINDTSLKLNGFEIAKIINYFPIISNENYISKDFDALMKSTLSSYGSLKSRIKNASTPVMLLDVTDVISRQLDFVSKYAAYAEIAQDLKRLRNFKNNQMNVSFVDSLAKKYGAQGVRFFDNLIDTINDANKKTYEPLDRLWGKAVTATLSMNVSSTLKQFAAYPTAAAVLGYEPLIKAMRYGVKKAPKDLIRKYTGMLDYRLGSANITREMNEVQKGNDLTKRMPMLMDWLNKMDAAIVGRLWYASEYYVQDHFGDLKKGSDEFYKKVAEVFKNTVFETQANYTPMERAGVQTIKGLRIFTSFKTDAYQAFGLMYNRTGKFRAASKRYNTAKSNGASQSTLNTLENEMKTARKNMINSYLAIILSNIATVLAAVAASVILRKWDRLKDEEGEITLESALGYSGGQLINNLAGMVTFLPELYTLVDATFLGGNWYDIQDIGLAAVNDLVNDTISSYKKIEALFSADIADMDEDEYERIKNDAIKAGFNLSSSIAKLFGIPLGNALNMGGALAGWIAQITGNNIDESKAVSKTALYDNMYTALLEGDDAHADELYNKLITAGASSKTILTQLKQRLVNDDMRFTEAAQNCIDGDFVEYQNIIEELATDTGFSESFIAETVQYKIDKIESGDGSNSQAGAPSSLDGIFSDKSIYGTYQLYIAVDNMDSENTEKIYEAVVNDKKQEYIDKGYDDKEAEKKAKSSVKSSLTSKIKPIMQELYKTDKQQFAKMRTFLLKYCGYDPKTVNNWATE